MRLQPIIYTADLEGQVSWWAAVLGAKPSYRSDMWTTFSVEGSTLALHHVDSLPAPGRMAISLIAGRSLDALSADLLGRGVSGVGDIVQQPFGRQLTLRDPDGNVVQINEHRS